ncbi:MAG: hypothetical protein QM640_16335 [Niabella sp.]
MSKAEIFENERATGYNQFVQTWIPNYHHFLDCLPKLLGETSSKNLLAVGCVLHFLDDNGNKLNLLKDIADRLVSGAAFVMLDITGDKKQIRQNLKILRLLLPDGLNEEQINNRLNRIESELFVVSEERLSELLQEAGFEPPLRFFQSSVYMGWLTKKK